MYALSNKKLLIAVTGMSPAVLTETVWALAHQEPPWVPDRVIAITTRTGKSAIEEMLLQGGGWRMLREVLVAQGLPVANAIAFGASDSIRVIGDGSRDLEDISTSEENGVAADFILGVLRQYTAQPDTEIVASIAGGRKTMSALMMACMSLLGRDQDRVCHVLADDAFIARHKGFLFPRTKAETAAARIQFYEIPFVRVRGWYEQESGKLPASYNHMVSLFRSLAPEALVEPAVALDLKNEALTIGGKELELTRTEFPVISTFIQSHISGSSQTGRPVKYEDEFRRALSSVRKKVEALIGKTLADRLIPDLRKTKYEYRTIQIKGGRPKTS